MDFYLKVEAGMRPKAGEEQTNGSTGRPRGGLSMLSLPRETLESVRRREKEALAELFEQCFEAVYNLAFRLTGDHTGAEDVSQDVFLKVYNAAPQIDPTRAIGPWLTAITYNACRERWRSRGYRLFSRSRSLNGTAGQRRPIVNGRRNPEKATEENERDRRIMKAVTGLPESMRVVVILHDYQGIPHEEIATLTGTRHATVRKRYSRALARLKDELKDVV